MVLVLKYGRYLSPLPPLTSFRYAWTLNYEMHFHCSMSVVEDSFEYLDAPVERIAGADVPTPYAANLERLAFPQVCFAASPILYKSG
jgi:hypothetical protein